MLCRPGGGDPRTFPIPAALFFLCFLAAIIGALWLDRMYRCPRCGCRLFVNKQDALLNRPCSFCPQCGWAVDIEMRP